MSKPPPEPFATLVPSPYYGQSRIEISDSAILSSGSIQVRSLPVGYTPQRQHVFPGQAERDQQDRRDAFRAAMLTTTQSVYNTRLAHLDPQICCPQCGALVGCVSTDSRSSWQFVRADVLHCLSDLDVRHINLHSLDYRLEPCNCWIESEVAGAIAAELNHRGAFGLACPIQLPNIAALQARYDALLAIFNDPLIDHVIAVTNTPNLDAVILEIIVAGLQRLDARLVVMRAADQPVDAVAPAFRGRARRLAVPLRPTS